jgi:hypothetical protein
MFAGHTIGFVNEIEELKKILKNTKTEVLFELQDIKSKKISNCLYRVSKGRIYSLFSNQLFTTSNEIEGNYELARRLLFELQTRRRFTLNNLNFLIIQCGELNILKNIQKDNNKVDFRLSDDLELRNTFLSIIAETNVFLNPIHTPMGNQGKMKKRREFLSSNHRYYFSASNTKKNSNDLSLNSLQYANYNQNSIEPENCKILDNAKSAIFEIS